MPGYFSPPPSDRPQASPSRRMDGTTRLVIVVGAVGLALYFFGPFVSGELREVGRQLSGDNRRTGFPPMWDPLGLMPGRGDREAAPDGRLRLPQGVGNASDDPRYLPPDDGYTPRPPSGARQYRECEVIEQRKICGPWQELPPPGRWRR